MKIAIIGLGYVGITTAAAFSKLGHCIIGYENNIAKLGSLYAGKLPITEPSVSELLQDNSERVSYIKDIDNGINNADLVVVSVGTPTSEIGETDLTALNFVMKELSMFRTSDLSILIRSTIPIGLSRKYSDLYPNLSIYFHPEFLREGTAIKDFFSPPKIVLGAKVADDSRAHAILESLYSEFDCPKFVVSFESAESVKYADNIFHALKVVFTNEISKVVAGKNADPREVMEIFRSDRQLNVSPAYLKPGFAYGGSCLEKDLLSFRTQGASCSLPLLDAIAISNEIIIEDFVNKICGFSSTFIFNGLTFKEDVDDLRRSPFVIMAFKLLAKGKEVYAYDDNLETCFGDSAEIYNRLLDQELFHINEDCCSARSDTSVIFCHEKRHSKLEQTFKADYELFFGGDAGRIFV